MAEIDRMERETAERDTYFKDTLNNKTYQRVRDQAVVDAIDALATGDNTTATIFNVSVGVAATEFSQALPANTKRFILKSRSSRKVSFYYTSAATETLTINPGFSFEDNNFYVAQTIYFKCSGTDTIEIVAYT